MKNNHYDEALEENEKLIIEYFKSVYYASYSGITNIFGHTGYRGEKEFSMLYILISLNFLLRNPKKDLTFPAMESYKDIYIEPTHVKTSYGHNVSTIDSYPLQEQGITVWLPLYLPVRTKPMLLYCKSIFLFLFITDNCRLYTINRKLSVCGKMKIILLWLPAIRRPR